MQNFFRLNVDEASRDDFITIQLVAPHYILNKDHECQEEIATVYSATLQVHWLAKAAGNTEKIVLKASDPSD